MPDGSKQALNTEGAVMRTLERGETIAVSKRDRCRLALSAPDRVDVVRSIFRGYVEDVRGFKTIADMLNSGQVPTPRGPAWLDRYSGRWAIGTVRAILCNPAYVGDMVWNRRTDARFHRIAQGRGAEPDRRHPALDRGPRADAAFRGPRGAAGRAAPMRRRDHA